MRKNHFTMNDLLIIVSVALIAESLLMGGIAKFHRSSKATTVHTTSTPAKVTQNDDATFNAWVKLTGNTKELTFEEWRVLKDQGLLK